MVWRLHRVMADTILCNWLLCAILPVFRVIWARLKLSLDIDLTWLLSVKNLSLLLLNLILPQKFSNSMDAWPGWHTNLLKLIWASLSEHFTNLFIYHFVLFLLYPMSSALGIRCVQISANQVGVYHVFTYICSHIELIQLIVRIRVKDMISSFGGEIVFFKVLLTCIDLLSIVI